MTLLSSPEMRSKLAASLARTAASVFICAMLDSPYFSFVLTSWRFGESSGRVAGKSCGGRLPVVVRVFRLVIREGGRCDQSVLRPAALLFLVLGSVHRRTAATAGAATHRRHRTRCTRGSTERRLRL